MRSRRITAIVLVTVGLLACSEGAALAQDASGESQVIEIGAAMTAGPSAAVAAVAEAPDDAPLPELSAGKRPGWFVPIHIFSIAVQALDAHSTLRLLEQRDLRGSSSYREMTGNKAAFLAVKAGVAAAVVFATDKLSKRHRLGAVVTAAAINSVYLTMAAGNYRAARAERVRVGL